DGAGHLFDGCRVLADMERESRTIDKGFGRVLEQSNCLRKRGACLLDFRQSGERDSALIIRLARVRMVDQVCVDVIHGTIPRMSRWLLARGAYVFTDR